jgi:hypothetical protein
MVALLLYLFVGRVSRNFIARWPQRNHINVGFAEARQDRSADRYVRTPRRWRLHTALTAAAIEKKKAPVKGPRST